MIALRVCLIFVCLSYASKSRWRCLNAKAVGFTDAPPFDGQSIELHFVDGYNETEVEETIAELQERDYLLSYDLCKDQRKREQEKEEQRKRDDHDRDQRLKAKWNIPQLEEACEQQKKEYAQAVERNKQKWFWEKPEKTYKLQETCPCGRSFNSSNLYDWMLHEDFPCAELNCAKKDVIFGKCHDDLVHRPDYWIGLPGESKKYECVNKIKLKI